MTSDLGETIFGIAFASISLASLVGFSGFLVYSYNHLNKLEDPQRQIPRRENIVETEYSAYQIDSVYSALMDFFNEDNTNKFRELGSGDLE